MEFDLYPTTYNSSFNDSSATDIQKALEEGVKKMYMEYQLHQLHQQAALNQQWRQELLYGPRYACACCGERHEPCEIDAKTMECAPMRRKRLLEEENEKLCKQNYEIQKAKDYKHKLHRLFFEHRARRLRKEREKKQMKYYEFKQQLYNQLITIDTRPLLLFSAST